jgi:hypothetical protein
MQKSINLDDLDKSLIETIEKEQSVELAELPRRYPKLRQIPYSTLWYRIDSLARAGYIRIERARQTVTCFSVQTGKADGSSTNNLDAPDPAPDFSGKQRRRENTA